MVISPECRAGNHAGCVQSTCDCECHDDNKPAVDIAPRHERVNWPHEYMPTEPYAGCAVCGIGPGAYIHNTSAAVATDQIERREMVNHPRHYGGADNPYEAIKIIEAHNLNFCLGNCVKYILRCDHKGTPLEDLKKAAWYLNREIENRERTHKTES